MGWFAFTKDFLKRLRGREYPGPNFTPRAQQVFGLAREEATRLRHDFIGTEHVLLGLIKLEKDVAYNVFQTLGLNPENVRKEVERQVGTGPIVRLAPSLSFTNQLGYSRPYTRRVNKALAWAREEAIALHHTYIGTEHLLLGLLREGDGTALEVLRNCGADLERVRVEVFKELNPNYNSDDEFYTRHFANLKETAKEEPPNQQSPQEINLNFTLRANQVLELARKEADRLNDNFVGTEHLLVGLIEFGNGAPANILASKGMTLETVRAEIEPFPGPAQKMFGTIPYTPQMNRVFRYAHAQTKTLNHTYIGTEHLLLGLLCQDYGPATDIFKRFDVDMKALHKEILNELNPPQ